MIAITKEELDKNTYKPKGIYYKAMTTPKEEEIREIEIFNLPSQDELRNEWVEFLRSAPNVDAEAIEWIVANFVEEKLVDLLNSQIKIRREAIAEEREKNIKEIYKFGLEHDWDNQVMSDINSYLSYGIDLSHLTQE